MYILFKYNMGRGHYYLLCGIIFYVIKEEIIICIPLKKCCIAHNYTKVKY